MKRVFSFLLICVLTCFSFYYTDKIISLSKSKDPLMEEINAYKEKNVISPVNGVLSANTMLVGEGGKVVDSNASYEKMKKLNYFNSSLLEYVDIVPDIRKKNHLYKLLEGKNTTSKEISFVFVVEDMSYLKQILYILKNNDVSATFFVDGALVEDNIYFFKDNLGKSSIGYYGYNNKYNEVSMTYTKGLYKDNINTSNYCLYINSSFLSSCVNYKISTIRPILIENNLYSYIKLEKKNGFIYQIEVNSFNIKELNSTIIYLKQKGYDILNINELLRE